ncbi:hypothetical protein BTW14_gp018 [BeAn 58058 virus]|nr:hypothetical protein BTW14_gp018 [BeAn 58058 virus]APG58209.1 hypothetical protein BAV00020 [BeAn 58058 virus]
MTVTLTYSNGKETTVLIDSKYCNERGCKYKFSTTDKFCA